LLKVKGKFRHVHVREVPLALSSMNDGDVFILDLGTKLYQFNGGESGPSERHKAAEVVQHIKESRNFHNIQVVVVDNDCPLDDEPEFWNLLGGKGPIAPPEDDEHASKETEIKLFRLSDRTGNLSFDPVAEGSAVKWDMFQSDDVYLLDKGYIVYVWVGKRASRDEKRSGMAYATKYILEAHAGFPLPAVVVPEQNSAVIQRLLE